METETVIDNPYWDAVTDHVGPDPWWPSAPFCINWLDYPGKGVPHRTDYVSRYAWTITSPEAVAFVAEQSGGKLVDPMAGTGYWAHVLDQMGVDVLAYDLHPADGGSANQWHKDQIPHAPVMQGDAVSVVSVHSDRTLLLSWPPYDEPIGSKVLRAYKGDRVIYIGEGHGGCCGSDAMFDRLARDWIEVADHAPVQWMGMHDFITVYDRKPTMTNPTT